LRLLGRFSPDLSGSAAHVLKGKLIGHESGPTNTALALFLSLDIDIFDPDFLGRNDSSWPHADMMTVQNIATREGRSCRSRS
jgi:hypothetical protein